MAGIFLLLTAAATVVMVFARISADADQSTLSESVLSIAENRGMYGLSGAARFFSGVTLIIAAWYLRKSRVIGEGPGAHLVLVLFAASGIITAFSGALAVALAVTVPEPVNRFSIPVDATTRALAITRWLTGKVGFTLMGLGLIVAAPYQWKAGGMLRYVAVASAAVGIAMLFIWFDAATIMHRISGNAVFIWLLVIGVMLLTGRIERQFAKLPGSN